MLEQLELCIFVCEIRLRVIVIVYKVTSSRGSRVVVCIRYLPMSPPIDSKAKASCLPSIFQPWSLLFRHTVSIGTAATHDTIYLDDVPSWPWYLGGLCRFFRSQNLHAKIREVYFLPLTDVSANLFLFSF